MYFSSSYSSSFYVSLSLLLLRFFFVRRRGAQFFFFMAENYFLYSQGKNLNSQLSPRFIFAHLQTTRSFPSLFFSFTTLSSSVSNDDDSSAASSSSASSSFCATFARVGGRFDDGVFRKKMSSSSSSSSSSSTRRRRGANARVLAKGGEGQIVVIGANGKTGKRCVKYAAENGWDVVAATRNGSFPSLTSDIKEEARGRVTTKQCSVTSSMAEITNAIDGAESVIFAASSSKDGGSPQEIDRDGCIKVARACLSSKSVKRYVVVTSGAVSKPYSPVYIFLNLFGGIMRAKIEGEDAVRALYYEREDDFYTIVRPGGLTEDPPRGVSACELNQGDDVSGRVSREDVAAVCVECLKRDDAKNATFELYYRDTGKPMAEVFASNANKETDGERQMGPRGRRGETWDELFAGLEADAPGIPQKGEGFSL